MTRLPHTDRNAVRISQWLNLTLSTNPTISPNDTHQFIILVHRWAVTSPSTYPYAVSAFWDSLAVSSKVFPYALYSQTLIVNWSFETFKLWLMLCQISTVFTKSVRQQIKSSVPIDINCMMESLWYFLHRFSGLRVKGVQVVVWHRWVIKQTC